MEDSERRRRRDDDRLPSPKRHKAAAEITTELSDYPSPSPPSVLSPVSSPLHLRSPPVPHRRSTTDERSPSSDPDDSTHQFSDSDDELLTSPPLPPHTQPALPQPPPSRATVPYNSFLSGCRSVFDSYTRIDTIDSGTYGTVHRALCNATQRTVALKKIKLEQVGGFPITALREINILMAVRHAHVVEVLEVVVGRSNDSVYVVMEYAESDVKRLLSSHRALFTMAVVKRLMYQLLTAVHHLHSHFLLHRDIKTSNLLYTNSPTPHLLLADFGLARPYTNPPTPLTPTVVTLWYRAPELLFGRVEYGTEVDVWSCGCVMAELLLGRPLLPGQGDMEQVGKIIQVMGSPSAEAWDELRRLDGVKGWRIKEQTERLTELFVDGGVLLTEEGWRVLRGMLEWRPSGRRSAKELLAMRWWDEEPRMEREERMPTITAPATTVPDNNHR